MQFDHCPISVKEAEIISAPWLSLWAEEGRGASRFAVHSSSPTVCISNSSAQHGVPFLMYPPREVPFPNSQKKTSQATVALGTQITSNSFLNFKKTQKDLPTWLRDRSQSQHEQEGFLRERPLTFTRRPVYSPNLLTNRESAYFLWSSCLSIFQKVHGQSAKASATEQNKYGD